MTTQPASRVSRPTVLAWRGQFEKDGLVGFGEVAAGRGRKPSISDEKVAEIVDLTLHSKPEGASCTSFPLLVVAQSGRTVVPGPDRQGHPPVPARAASTANRAAVPAPTRASSPWCWEAHSW